MSGYAVPTRRSRQNRYEAQTAPNTGPVQTMTSATVAGRDVVKYSPGGSTTICTAAPAGTIKAAISPVIPGCPASAPTAPRMSPKADPSTGDRTRPRARSQAQGARHHRVVLASVQSAQIGATASPTGSPCPVICTVSEGYPHTPGHNSNLDRLREVQPRQAGAHHQREILLGLGVDEDRIYLDHGSPAPTATDPASIGPWRRSGPATPSSYRSPPARSLTPVTSTTPSPSAT